MARLDDDFRNHEGDEQYWWQETSDSPATRYRSLFHFIISITIVILLFLAVMKAIVVSVIGQEISTEHNHPPEHAQLHEDFYSGWMKPDNPTISCCNKQDCAPAQVRFEDGKYYVKSIWNGVWVYFSPEKIDWARQSPDGRSHACMSKSNVPFCLVLGQGT